MRRALGAVGAAGGSVLGLVYLVGDPGEVFSPSASVQRVPFPSPGGSKEEIIAAQIKAARALSNDGCVVLCSNSSDGDSGVGLLATLKLHTRAAAKATLDSWLLKVSVRQM